MAAPSNSAAYLNMDVDRLIEEIKSRPQLWDYQNKLNNNVEVRQRLWLEIAEVMNSSVEDIKKKWKVLKDVFRREVKKLYVGSKREPVWAHFNSLLFLRSQLNSKESTLYYSPTNGNNNEDLMKHIQNGTNEDSEQESLKVPSPYEETTSSSFESDAKYFAPAAASSDESRALLNVSVIYDSNPNLEHQNDDEIFLKTTSNTQSEIGNEDGKTAGRNSDLSSIAMNVKRCHDDLEIEDLFQQQQKRQPVTFMNSSFTQTIHHTDDDYNFLLSFLPSMRAMPLQKKMLFRLKMQQLLYTTMFEEETTQVASTN